MVPNGGGGGGRQNEEREQEKDNNSKKEKREREREREMGYKRTVTDVFCSPELASESCSWSHLDVTGPDLESMARSHVSLALFVT